MVKSAPQVGVAFLLKSAFVCTKSLHIWVERFSKDLSSCL